MAQEEANPPVGGPFWQLVHPGEVDPTVFRLPEAMIFVGREECDITVKARSVDKRHAVIMYDYCDKRFKVKDLNSTNGTFVNEVRIPVQTYIQLDSMDMLRFGFDSAAFQVVRVPGPGEIMTVPAVVQQQQQQNGFREETSSNSRPSTPQEATSVPTIREERAASEEPAVTRAAVARNLSAPPELVAAVSNSSLHSAFSEDSLLGDVAKPAGGAAHGVSPATSPGSRVPVDAVRTLGPCGPKVPDLWGTSSTRRSCTAPTRGQHQANTSRSSLRRANKQTTNATPSKEASKEERTVAPPVTLAPAVTEPPPEVPSPPVTTPLSPVPELPPTPQQNTPSPSESTSISSSSGTTGGEDSSASSSAALPPPQPPQLHPMAFTVDFTDLGGSKRLDIGDSISKFVPRHRRNLSVSRQEEAKQQRQEKLQQQESAGKQPPSPPSRQPPQQAPSPTLARHPPAPSQSPTPRHAPQSSSPSNSRHNAVSPPSRPNAAAAAPTQSPTSRQAPPVAQLQMRRAGYHSEGYFSSDQEEDLSTKSDLSVRKAKGLEKGPGRTTNLAQEKRTKPEPLPLANPEVSRPAALMDRRSASLEESASEHFSRILGEASSPVRRQASCGTQDEGSCRSRQCQATSPQSTEVQPDTEDNVSEAGTYTIDKESPSPEERRARNEIDVVFGVQDVPTSPVCDTRTFTRPVKVADTNGLPAPSPQHHDEPVKTASYRGGPNWIKEWAAQVAEQQRDLESVQLPSRGRVSPGGRGAPTSPLLSPVMGWPPPSQQQQPVEPAGLRGPRHKLQQVSTASPVLSDHSDPTESPARRRPIQLQPDTETESYLRTTESVVTAMQARVTAAEEGPSAEELSAQLRARLRVLEHKASSVPPPQPAPGPVRKLAARTQPRVSGEGQSDSSSEAGDKPPRSRADSAGPHTRYNRAFSLRRARLEAEEAERNRTAKPASAPVSARGPPRLAQQAAQRPRKLEPARPTNSTPGNTKPPMHTSASSGNFSRADGGRFSLRAGKVANQAPVIPKVQRPAANPARTPLSSGNKKSSSSSARSNSSLHAREVEFQNWKRRKSYDPMKAAAEGKKKAEAARKTGGQAQQQPNVMTQSAIVPNTNSSPHSSPLNSILRSASFHGTGGVARQMLRHQHGSSAATSEDEATLSAEEDEDEVMVVHQFSSPASGSPRHARPSPLPPPLRCTSQPPDPGVPRKSSLDETLEGSNSRGFTRNTTPTSSVRSRGKLEALDNLVIAAIHGFSNKIKGSSHNVLSKLRVLFQEDPEKASMLEETLALLEEGEPPTSSPSKSPSKELSGTLRNLKKLEHVFTVLDEVLFGDEEVLDDEDEDLEVEEEEEELSDLEADQLQAI